MFLIWKRKTVPSLVTGAIWFLITIGPTLGVLRAGNSLAADRYCYLPLIGLVIALAGLGPILLKRRPHLLLATLFLFSGGLLFATHQQISHWRSQKALFTKALQDDPENLAAHIELAQIARKAGDMATMNLHLNEALRIAPKSASAHIILAHLALTSSDYSKAYHHFEIASQIRPQEAWLQERLAAAAYGNNNIELTRDHMTAAFRLARPTDRELELEKKWHLIFPEEPLPEAK